MFLSEKKPVTGLYVSSPTKRISCNLCESRRTCRGHNLRTLCGDVHRVYSFSVAFFDDPSSAHEEGVLFNKLLEGISRPFSQACERFGIWGEVEVSAVFDHGPTVQAIVGGVFDNRIAVRSTVSRFVDKFPSKWTKVFTSGVVAVFVTVRSGMKSTRCWKMGLDRNHACLLPRLTHMMLLRSEVENNGVGHYVPKSFAVAAGSHQGNVTYRAVNGEGFHFDNSSVLKTLLENYTPMRSILPTKNAQYAK